MKYQNHIKTSNSVTVFFDSAIKTVPSTSKIYKRVVALINAKQFNKIEDVVDKVRLIEKKSKQKIKVVKGKVLIYGKEELPYELNNKLLQMVEANISVKPLLNFWDRLHNNPSPSARKGLYGFMLSNQVPLNEDGTFLTYKKVNKNYKDIHTHTFDNSVGKIVRMTRKDVVEDPNQTCERGLHVAAFDYAKTQYGAAKDPIIVCEVDPANVVSVPTDYNQQKMRVCEYRVVAKYRSGKAMTDIVNRKRTYYLLKFGVRKIKGERKKVFDAKFVISKRPDRFIETTRAISKKEAVEQFFEKYKSKVVCV